MANSDHFHGEFRSLEFSSNWIFIFTTGEFMRMYNWRIDELSLPSLAMCDCGVEGWICKNLLRKPLAKASCESLCGSLCERHCGQHCETILKQNHMYINKYI